MREILFIALVGVGLGIASANDCLAQDKLHERTTDEMIRRITQAQKQGRIVRIALKDGRMKWGRPAHVSAESFSLSDVAADGSNMEVLLRYDQVTSVRFESGWIKAVRGIRDVVTAPIVVPVLMVWAHRRFQC
jgi:hypothetical protein